VVTVTPTRLSQPVGVPSEARREDETEWAALVYAQLSDVRKSAENWRNGLAGLVTLAGTYWMVRGPSALSELEGWAVNTAGVLLLVSAVAALVGAVASLRAAYGHPVVLSRARFLELGGAQGYRFEQALRAASDLRLARQMTVLAFILIIGTVGLISYGPRSAVDTVQVTTRTGTQVCGRLLHSGDGRIQLDSITAGSVLVDLGEVTRIQVVQQCT
jgi:hypothetical protein